MSAPCGVPLGLCATRLTRLDETTGAVSADTNNSFVTTNQISVQFSPVVEAGADLTLTGGCDCVIASYRGVDKLKRFDFTITDPVFAPAMYELMIGGTLISSGSTPVGIGWPAELACGDSPPLTALEFWVKNIEGDAPNPTYPWIHGVYPASRWQIGQQTFQNDFAQPTLTGFTRRNALWGDGPYGDGPGTEYGAADGVLASGGQFYTATDPPTSTDCGYQHVVPSS